MGAIDRRTNSTVSKSTASTNTKSPRGLYRPQFDGCIQTGSMKVGASKWKNLLASFELSVALHYAGKPLTTQATTSAGTSLVAMLSFKVLTRHLLKTLDFLAVLNASLFSTLTSSVLFHQLERVHSRLHDMLVLMRVCVY